MKTLFLTFATALAASALAWFFSWAVWIHAPQAWYGRALGPIAAARRARSPDHPAVRHLAWYRRLKITTWVLFVISAVLFWLWHANISS